MIPVWLLVSKQGLSGQCSNPRFWRNDASSLNHSFGDFRKPYNALRNFQTLPRWRYPGGQVVYYFFIYVCIGECVLEVDLVTKEPKYPDKSHENSEAAICTSCFI